jgi:hypothetical protein
MPRRSAAAVALAAAASQEEEEQEEDYDVEQDDDNDDGGDDDENFQVCQGQTEEERRKIRKEQRELFKDMEEKNIEVEEARGRNNEIYRNVKYTREAVLDGENLILIANKAAKKVDQLIQVRIVVVKKEPYCYERMMNEVFQFHCYLISILFVRSLL